MCTAKDKTRNINQATLFPDLDGFAGSLRTRIAHPGSLGLNDMHD